MLKQDDKYEKLVILQLASFVHLNPIHSYEL